MNLGWVWHPNLYPNLFWFYVFQGRVWRLICLLKMWNWTKPKPLLGKFFLFKRKVEQSWMTNEDEWLGMITKHLNHLSHLCLTKTGVDDESWSDFASKGTSSHQRCPFGWRHWGGVVCQKKLVRNSFTRIVFVGIFHIVSTNSQPREFIFQKDVLWFRCLKVFHGEACPFLYWRDL